MALTPDSIPTSEQVQETLFDRFYFPYKKQIWATGGVLAIAILAFLGHREWRIRERNEQANRLDAALFAGGPGAPASSEQRIALLEAVVRDFPNHDVTPFALDALVHTYAEAERYDDALRTLDQLRTRFKDFVTNTASADTRADGQPRSLAERLETMLRAERDWRAKTAYVHPEPKLDRQALVETTSGSFWVAFYPDHAPAHVDNFVQLAKSGYFNGTQVYDVRRATAPNVGGPLSFEAGSAASRYEGADALRDPGAHDADEPGHTIDPEDSRFTIRHRRGIVSSVVMPSGESARRFLVVCTPDGLEATYNGNNTPFAAVIDKEGSFDTIQKISVAPTYGTDPTTENHPETGRMRNHPYPPIWIRRVTIWKDEKLEAGHTFDTAAAGAQPSKPEPWEATLPPPPKPEEFAPK